MIEGFEKDQNMNSFKPIFMHATYDLMSFSSSSSFSFSFRFFLLWRSYLTSPGQLHVHVSTYLPYLPYLPE